METITFYLPPALIYVFIAWCGVLFIRWVVGWLTGA